MSRATPLVTNTISYHGSLAGIRETMMSEAEADEILAQHVKGYAAREIAAADDRWRPWNRRGECVVEL